MAKLSKKLWVRVLVPTALVLALILIAIPILIFTLDKENLRQTLTATLSEKTGFKVDIQSMGINFSSGVGISAESISIHTADGKHHLFSIESLFLQARILPLLIGKFKIKNAVINKPVINIFIDQPEIMSPQTSEDGLKDLQPSLDPKEKEEAPQSREPEKNESHEFPEDSSDPKNQKLESFPEEKIISFLRNMLREYDFAVKNISVKNGLAHIVKRINKKNRREQPLKFSFNLKLLRPGGDQVDAALDQFQLELGEIILRGSLQADNILSDESILKLNLKSDPFTGSQLRRIGEFYPAGFAKKISQYPIEGLFKSLHLTASIPLNSLEDSGAFMSTLSAQSRFHADNLSIGIGKWGFPIDHLESTGVWNKGKIKHRMEIRAFGGELLIDKSLRFSQEPKTKNSLLLTSKIKLTNIDLSKISSPRGSYASGILSGLIKMQGSLTPDYKVKLKGSLSGKDIDINSAGFTYAAENLDLKLKSSSSFTPILEAHLNNLEIYNIPFKAYIGRVAFPADRVVFLKSILIPPNGKIGWTGTFHTKSMKYQFEVAGRKLKVEDFDPQNINGDLKLTAKVHGYVPKKESFSRGLSGNVAIRIWKGGFTQLDTIEGLLTILNPTSIFSREEEGLGFDLLGGDITIDEGLLKSRNITLEGSQINLYLKGLWDLPTGNVNMDGKFLPSPDLDNILKSIPIIGQILAGSKRQDGFLETYFTVRGDISQPDIQIQMGKSIFEKPGRMLSQIGSLVE